MKALLQPKESNSSATFEMVPNPQRTRAGNPCIGRPHAAFAEAHTPAFVVRENSSIIASRIANFWTLPVTVDGKLSTKRM